MPVIGTYMCYMGMIISIQQFDYFLHKIQGTVEAPLACSGNRWTIILKKTYKLALFSSGYKVLFVSN